jgi:hypothetical protein
MIIFVKEKGVIVKRTVNVIPGVEKGADYENQLPLLNIATVVCNYYRLPMERIRQSYGGTRCQEAKAMFVFMVKANEPDFGTHRICKFLNIADDFSSYKNLWSRIQTTKAYDQQVRDDIHAIQLLIDKMYLGLRKAQVVHSKKQAA